MELALSAAFDATVTAIACEPGAMVGEGQELVMLEPTSPAS